MEEFLTRYPHYADFKRMEEESKALHIAASNDKLEVLKYLCSLVRLMYCLCFMSACMQYTHNMHTLYTRQYNILVHITRAKEWNITGKITLILCTCISYYAATYSQLYSDLASIHML